MDDTVKFVGLTDDVDVRLSKLGKQYNNIPQSGGTIFVISAEEGVLQPSQKKLQCWEEGCLRVTVGRPRKKVRGYFSRSSERRALAERAAEKSQTALQRMTWNVVG